MNEHNALAVIIGRAGSKGLPGKNARLLAGVPMIAYSIRHAAAAQTVSRCVVSTDGSEIAEAASTHGADVVDRPATLASDTATVDSAVRHAVETIDPDAEHDLIVILYANVPIRPPDLIDRAVWTLIETGCDSVQSYCLVGKHHPMWMVRLGTAGEVEPYTSARIYRRQDLPALYLPDGGVIAVRRPSLFTTSPDDPHAFLGADRRGMETRPGDVIDIDDLADLAMAEAMMSMQQHHGA